MATDIGRDTIQPTPNYGELVVALQGGLRGCDMSDNQTCRICKQANDNVVVCYIRLVGDGMFNKQPIFGKTYCCKSCFKKVNRASQMPSSRHWLVHFVVLLFCAFLVVFLGIILGLLALVIIECIIARTGPDGTRLLYVRRYPKSEKALGRDIMTKFELETGSTSLVEPAQIFRDVDDDAEIIDLDETEIAKRVQSLSDNSCLDCGKTIPESTSKCPNCGWSWKEQERQSAGAQDFDPENEGIMDDSTYNAELEDRREGSFVPLANFWNAPEAYVVCSRLEAEGIRCFVADELTSTAFTGMGSLAGSATIQVAQKDIERARLIYENLQDHGDLESEE